MTEEKTTGLILRTRLLTETSLIVHWLTPDFGRIATVAKGARRQKSIFRGKLDLFYRADFSFTRSARSELHNLREIVLRDMHVALREDMTKLQQASYAAALIEQTTETETPLPEVYDLMLATLGQLVARPPNAGTMFAFELKMLQLLGQSPDLDRSALSAGTRQIATHLGMDDWDATARLKLSPAQTSELRQFLHGFLIYHLGKLPSGRAEALQV
jgi:DNA repair protein RecO (recombination protein O)